MTPAPRPHRPRPTPHHAPRPTATTDDEPRLPGMHRPSGSQPIRVPSLLAAMKRTPSSRSSASGLGVARGASVGAIAVGATLFVVAALATPVVSANVADKRSEPTPSATSEPTTSSALPTVVPVTPAPVVAVDQRPEAATKAPSDPKAISSLAANGIPQVALNAYRVAAARVDNADPGCGIDWSLLAGIGRAESDHGRFAGSKLLSDGTSAPAIVGPALTGQVWDFIPASAEYVAVTGDAKYAHALGPMQFIPSTWQMYGSDGNSDGKADIFNVNDAALAAARYLCAAGGDLTTEAGRQRAVLAYNHNDQYLAQVLALADAYKRGVPISGIPVGDVTGSLPKIGRSGALPPVNPGAPTAADKDTKDRAKSKQKTTPKPGTSGGATSGGTGGSGGSGTGGSGSTGGGSGSGGTGSGGSGSGGTGGGSGSGGSDGSGGGSGSQPTTPAPSNPIDEPTKRACNGLEKIADNLKPVDQRVCA